MKQHDLVSYLDSYLQIASFAPIDYSLNGLVVSTPDEKEVRTIAVAVDASLSTFEKAIEERCDFLIVHHGLFWGAPIAITEAHYRRVKALMDSGMSLYVAHLPLDAHPEVGNNAQMALALELEEIEPFSPYKGVPIGVRGRFTEERDTAWVCDRLGFADATVLPLGKRSCSSVGIVSGGGSDDLSDAIALGLDLFITGEVKHQAYHEALEAHTTVIAGGHYDTEVFGVRSLGEHLSKRFALDVRFIANPTGL